MNIEEFKERLIKDGIESVKTEKIPQRVTGGIKGFELCRSLNSKWDFEEELNRRNAEEISMVNDHTNMLTYWEYRYATIQVQFVYETMLVVWAHIGLYSGPVSSRAILRYQSILDKAELEKGI